MGLKITINDSIIFSNSTIEDTDWDDVMLATEILHWAEGWIISHPSVTKIEIEVI